MNRLSCIGPSSSYSYLCTLSRRPSESTSEFQRLTTAQRHCSSDVGCSRARIIVVIEAISVRGDRGGEILNQDTNVLSTSVTMNCDYKRSAFTDCTNRCRPCSSGVHCIPASWLRYMLQAIHDGHNDSSLLHHLVRRVA